MNTKIKYMYRDADNYKDFTTVVVSGKITKEQIERIMAGENEFHKSMFRMLANFDDEDLIALERLVKKLAQTKE